jgi:hypothetical protein
MTRVTFSVLTRHFAAAILAPPILTDLGVDYLRRTLASLLGILIVIGVFLPRLFSRKYIELYAIVPHEPYLRAVQADTLMMIAIPMLIIALIAVVLCPLLFPDETDYRVLTPLPITRAQLFASKLLAVVVVMLVAVVAVDFLASAWFPIVIGGRRAEHSTIARVGAHLVASLAGSTWAFLAVMALQGACLSVVPAAWQRRASVLVQAGLFVGLLLAIPFVTRIPRMTVLQDTVMTTSLAWLPPTWFLGVERLLLDGPEAGGYGAAADAALLMSALVVVIIFAVYARLYLSAERLAGMSGSSRARRSRGLWLLDRVPPPTASVLSFIASGLSRSRLHQFVFLLIAGTGAAITIARNEVVSAPLVAALFAGLGLRAVLLLPIDRGAAWVFQVTEDSRTRARALDGVAYAFSWSVIGLSLVVTLALQRSLASPAWGFGALFTVFADLVMVEILIGDWRRMPYACTYIPGKRVLAYNLGVLLAWYFVFVWIGTNLIRWAMVHPARTLALGVAQLAALTVLRRARLRLWGKLPLEFEDEDPLAVRHLGLAADERP